MADTPNLFRVILQVAHLDQAVDFYTTLLGVHGRKVGGSRAYFDCGHVILALLDLTPGGKQPVANADDIYFSVADLEPYHARAHALGCLSKETVHSASGAEILTRPWGERSFYAEDPWGNGLCFVDAGTLFTGLEQAGPQ